MGMAFGYKTTMGQHDTTARAPPSDYNPTVGARRADLVLFQGDHKNKTQTDFLCLVEFKKGYFGLGDLKKLNDWFRFLDTCKYGMLCGYIELPNEAYLNQLQRDAEGAGDKWVLGRIARPLDTPQNFQSFARVLENPNYRR